jgi:hypothetical protein
MANDPPFATLNHFAADLGIPSESDLLRIGISPAVSMVSIGAKGHHDHPALGSLRERLPASLGDLHARNAPPVI